MLGLVCWGVLVPFLEFLYSGFDYQSPANWRIDGPFENLADRPIFLIALAAPILAWAASQAREWMGKR